MKKIILLLFCLLSAEAYGQDKGLPFYYAQAKEAYRKKSYPKFYEMIKEAHTLSPYHQGILYQLGLAASLTGRKEEAIENLKQAILIDNRFKLEGLADFNLIKGTPEFLKLLDLQKELGRRIIHSDTAFVITDRSLHAEGIEFDPVDNTFYLGSIHKRKIIARTPDGRVTDFCQEGIEGMTSIFGIKADAKRNVLWACSSPVPEMENYDSAARSAVFKFDLTTRKLIEKFQRSRYERDGDFGDLILSDDGEVFVSDGKNNMIFKVNEKRHQLEPFFGSPDFLNMQGLAFSKNEKYMFVSDYVKGIFRLTLRTREFVPISCSLDASLKGIDGLLYYENSLIAIQNGVNPSRIVRYFLNSSQNQIIRYEVIDRKHPAFGEPTMGVVAGDVLYYIANSQWGGYTENHQIKPNDQLQDIVILKSKLDH
jgi:sugar lactone lactonase YvrE